MFMFILSRLGAKIETRSLFEGIRHAFQVKRFEEKCEEVGTLRIQA
jgi:hypothetical protein